MLKLYAYEYDEFEELEGYLYTLCYTKDNDMNGENGEDYLWEDAKKMGFKTNIDYLSSTLGNIMWDEDIDDMRNYVREFLHSWLNSNDYYYLDWSYSVIDLEKGGYVVSIAIEEDCY